MYKKLIFTISFISVLIMVNSSYAEMVGHWRFDGDLSDSFGDAHGTFSVGSPTYVTGRIGQGIDFDGFSQFIHIPSENPSAYTISLWVRPARTDAASVIVRTSGSGPTTHWSHQLRINPQGTFHHYLWVGSERNIAGRTLVEADEWYHVAIAAENNGPMYLYVNGEEDATSINIDGTLWGEGDRYYVGSNSGHNMGWFQGVVDDVQIYDSILTADEIAKIAASSGGFPMAFAPSPKDGALYSDTWVSMSWRPGDFAISHDIYLGENFDDVNEATRDSDVYRGNQGLGTEFFIAGFFGYPYPDGLVNGTTYYWRIDEVNDADPNSPWKGDVWSFTVPPKTAYNPVPSNGAKFVDVEDPTLSWTAGFGSKLHFVYFGDDYDTVANAAGAPPSAFTTYSPGPLEIEKTYYWRIDESDGVNTFTGDVWSFTTAKIGGGLKGEYFNNTDLSGAPVLTRIDPLINVYWNPGPVGPGVSEDNFSVRWTGELEAPFSEKFTFIIGCDDGARMYLNGELIINDWGGGHDYTEFRSEPLDLVAGEYYSIVVEGFELGGEAEWRLFWQSPSVARQNVPQAALSLPVKASAPYPSSGETGTKMTPILRWGAGDYATSHEVYFGTDADAVKNADKSSPEYKGTKALGDKSFDPGKLAWHTQYFWRIDEVNAVNPDSPWIGNLWNFTTGDFIVVDDFEDYEVDKPIWEYWLDGVGFGTPGNPGFYGGNGTGAAVGDENSPSYMEETIVHNGSKSFLVAYKNNDPGSAKYSETELTLTAPRDWTEENVAELSIWFRGYAGSVGSFIEGPIGTYTMTGSGADIWDIGSAGDYHDEFHFAYKMLTGAGSIVAKVESVEETSGWAKAGVMIRETLDGGSKHAFACVTPSNGVASQGRPDTGVASFNTNESGITAPHWVKLERSISGLFTVSHSANGSSWQPVAGATPQNIAMGSNVYIGLALTSHDAALTCQAVFSNVTTTGNVSGQWASQDIGIESNDAEPLYVAVSNANGTSAVVIHDDPAAAQIDTWTEWVIPLSAFADQGINLSDVDRIAIGLGTQGNMTVPGGKGKMYIDDIRLYQPREAAE